MDVRSVDTLMNTIGDPGKFQLVTYSFLVTNMLLVLSNHLAMVFYAAKTKHHCKLESGESVEDRVSVVRNHERELDGCHLYAGNDTTQTIPCTDGWTYYFEDGETTIISEFDLVCDNAYKSDLAITIYFSGVMVGALSYGFLADKYGRKPVLAFALFVAGVLGVSIVLFRTYIAFVILRFLLGIKIQGILNTSFVLALEMFPTKYRAQAGVFFGILSVSGAAMFGLFAYLIRDWKFIQLAISVIPFIQLLLLCFVPESLRWLLLRKKFNQAEMVVRRTVAFNKLPFPSEAFDQIIKSASSTKEASGHTQQRKANVLDLFRSRTLRKTSCILIIVWFTVSAAYFGLSFNISHLFGDKYMNFGIGTAVDMCGVVLMFFAVPRFGRRKPLVLAFFLSGIANVISLIILTSVSSDSKVVNGLGTAAVLFGRSCALSTLNVLSIFTAELYPTVVRSIGLGVNFVWTRIGGMAAPLIFRLPLHFLTLPGFFHLIHCQGTYTSSSVPYAIIGALTLLSSFLVLLLPETHNKALMDTLENTNQLFEKTIVNPDEDETTADEEKHNFCHETSL